MDTHAYFKLFFVSETRAKNKVKYILRCTPVRPMAWLAAAVFTLSCKYFYEAIMAEDDDEDHGKRE